VKVWAPRWRSSASSISSGSSQCPAVSELRHRGAQTFTKSEPPLPHLARVGIVGRGPGGLAHLLLDLFQKLLDAAAVATAFARSTLTMARWVSR